MNNPYIGALLKTVRDRYAVEGAGMTTGQWLEANTHHRGLPFSFRKYGFQRAIADDLHPELDVMKISQVGLSEIQMRKMLAALVRNPGRVGIFSMPNEAMYRRFSQSRLLPLVSEEKVFKAREGEVRSMSLIQLGTSFLHVVNATEASATSTSADLVFNDEVDISDQQVLALFASRTQNSDMAIRQRFSTPTWTGFGIDATYSVSDQREYMIRCPACRRHQVPLFDHRWVCIPGLTADVPLHDLDDATITDLPLDDAYVRCFHCSAMLDLDNPDREWVAAHPSRTQARGYRVRPFTSGRITIPYILRRLVEYRRRDYVRGWYNTVLGEPYIDARSRLDEAAIRANFVSPGVPDVAPGTGVYLGIDVGQVCHLVLGKEGGEGPVAFEFRTIRANEIVSEVKLIKEQYALLGGTCDRHPYTPTADELFDVTEGRIIPLEYRGEMDFRPVKQPDDTVRHWQANRTRLLDEVVRLIRRKQLPMMGYGAQSGVIVEHLRDMIRQEDPEKPATWVKLNGNDHYFHALGFLVAAYRLQGVRAGLEGLDARTSALVSIAPTPLVAGLYARRGFERRGILN